MLRRLTSPNAAPSILRGDSYGRYASPDSVDDLDELCVGHE